MNLKLKSSWAEHAYWKMIDDKKIYFVNSDKIGDAYALISKLIVSGLTSSSGARKIMEKIKEGE